MDRNKIGELFSLLLIIKLGHGQYVKNKFQRTFGTGGLDVVSCVSDITKDRDALAARIDASDTCANLDWGWGLSPSYDSGSTYYEKKHFLEEYIPPKYLSGTMLLPVRFGVGAYVNMNITFFTDDFSYSVIHLLDTADPSFDLLDDVIETRMITLELRPQSDYAVIVSERTMWTTHRTITPYPFPAGSTHVITFKALTNELQILIDGVVLNLDIPLTNIVLAQDAKQVYFGCCAMHLNSIEFVGV